MPDTFDVVVPGDAVPQGRPRAFNAGGRIRMHAHQPSLRYAEFVRASFAAKYPDATPLQGPLKLEVAFFRVPPKSMSKKKRALALTGDLLPETRPDLDNLVKGIEDALNGVAYGDDAQIAVLSAQKAYADSAYTRILLSPVAQNGQRTL